MKVIYTPQTAAEQLKVGKRTVLKWLHTGELRGSKLGPKTWRILGEDLEAFLKAKREGSK